MKIKLDPARAYRIAFTFLLVTAASGALLRAQMLWPCDWLVYRHLVHAHSHIAFYGWVLNAVFAYSLYAWIPVARRPLAARLFWMLQFANIGMLVSFLCQGYGAVSITFTTLHLIVSICWIRILWRAPDIRPDVQPWLRWAIIFFLLSALGPLLLGPLAALDLRGHPAYLLALYGFLHFQYNGWFPLALLAAVLTQGGHSGLTRSTRPIHLFALGVILTFAQSTLWLEPPSIVYLLGAAGALLQLIGLGQLVRATWRSPSSLLYRSNRIIALAGSALIFKVFLQFLATLPPFTSIANHPYVAIAFLHLVFLGVITVGWLGLAASLGQTVPRWRAWCGWSTFLAAFTGSEVLLVLTVVWPSLPGPFLVASPQILFLMACLQLIGLCLLFPTCSKRKQILEARDTKALKPLDSTLILAKS